MKLLGLATQAPKISEQQKKIIKEYFSENFEIKGECSQKLNQLYIKVDSQEWKTPEELGLGGDHTCSDDGLYSFSGLATVYGYIDENDFKTVNLQIKGENDFGESGVATMSLDYKAENNELIKPSLWEEVTQRTSSQIELKIHTTDLRVERLELYRTVGDTVVDCSIGTQKLNDPTDTNNFQKSGDYSVWHTELGLLPAQKYNFIVCAYDQGKTRVSKSDVLTVYTNASVQHAVLNPGNYYWGAYGTNLNDNPANDHNHYFSEEINSPCNPSSAASQEYCMHLGAMKKVSLPGLQDCSDLTFKDALDLFHWYCNDQDFADVTFTAQGFKDGKSLADAIDFSAASWKKNKISIWKNGDKIIQSSPIEWWNNPIQQVTTSGQVLSTAYDVYIYDDTTVDRISIDGSNISFVMSPGRSFNNPTGVQSLPGINVENSSFIWIEGAVENYSNIAGVKLSNSNFVNIRNLKSIKNEKGIEILGSKFVNISNSKLGFSVYGAYLRGSANIVIQNSHFMNNSNNALEITAGTPVNKNLSVINSILSNSIKGINIYSINDGANLFGFLSVLSNSNRGIQSIQQNTTGEHYFNNLYIQNIGNIGFTFGDPFQVSQNNYFSNILSMNNQTSYKIDNLDLSKTIVKGSLYHEGSGSLNASGSSPPNVIINKQMNNATSWMDSLVGLVTNDSVQTTIAEQGSKLNISNLNFDNWSRFWTKYSPAPYPSVGYQGECSSYNCVIMDTSIKTGASLLGRAHDHSSNDTLEFKPGESCPISVDSSVSDNVFIEGSKNFLVYAVEITDDYLGNNDGFCEANERCVWAPNIGAYQGHGLLDYNKACNYTNSESFFNIKLIAYPRNGR